MNIQELLTYIEELSFKNSMFGYDKDDVDIQLDKICDEMEALVAAKDKEINALKRGGAVAAESVKNADEDITVEEKVDSQSERTGDLSIENMSKDEIKKTFSNMEKELKILRKTAAKAEADLKEAVAAKEAAETRLKETEEALEAAKQQLDSAQAESSEMTADTAEEPRTPQNKDEAYNQYLRNAELLCKQLDELETRRDAVLNTAGSQAERIIADAKAQADGIIDSAERNARRINNAADAKVKSAEEDVQRIKEEGRRRAEQEQRRCDEIVAQKNKLVAYLSGVTGDIKELIEKVQVPYEELEKELDQ